MNKDMQEFENLKSKYGLDYDKVFEVYITNFLLIKGILKAKAKLVHNDGTIEVLSIEYSDGTVEDLSKARDERHPEGCLLYKRSWYMTKEEATLAARAYIDSQIEDCCKEIGRQNKEIEKLMKLSKEL